MRRTREYDSTKISFTLTKAGCKEGPPAEITGGELSDLCAQVRHRKPKSGPKTKGQAETSALLTEFVKRGMGL